MALVIGLSLCSCGGNEKGEKKNPIVGVWRYKMMGATFTFNFKSDGKFSYTVDGIEGSSQMKDTGEYTYNEEDGTITLVYDNGDQSTKNVEIRDCCLITREDINGEVFEEKYERSLLQKILKTGSLGSLFSCFRKALVFEAVVRLMRRPLPIR